MTHLSAGRNKEALADLDAALEYPENLGTGRPERAGSSATVQYWRGLVLRNLGRADDANKAWQEATGGMRFGRRRGFYGADSALSAVHSVIILRRLGQTAQADDLARQIQEACDRMEDYDPPQSTAYAALVRGFLAAANGQARVPQTQKTALADPDQAARLLDQAQSASPRVAGYVRLVRTWVGLLGQSPATKPAAP
jgi:tetratricopeptide (TPR) repeat protein